MLKTHTAVTEEMQLMLGVIEPNHLASAYSNIFTNIAVVGSLVVGFGFSAMSTRLEQPKNGVDDLWGEHTETVINLYGLVMGLALILGFGGILYGILMMIMFGQMPPEGASIMVRKAAGRCQLGFGVMFVTLILFMVAVMLSLSVLYPVWVAVPLISFFVVTLIFFLWPFQNSVQTMRMEILRDLFHKKYAKKED